MAVHIADRFHRLLWSRFTVGLWANHDFLKLWAGQTVSLFGSAITTIALPLTAILALHASPGEVGVLTALRWLPSLLFGLLAGAWVDRTRRRSLMITADLGRFVLLGLIPLTAVFHLLSLALLYAIAFLSATLSLVFLVGYRAYLPSLVDRDHLVSANSKLSSSLSGAQVAGPGLAGILIQLVTAPMAIIADALSFLVSALFLGLIAHPESTAAKAEHGHIISDIREGLREVFGHSLLRAVAVADGIANLSWSAQAALFVLYMSRTVGLSAAAIGLVFAAGNVGMLLATFLVQRVTSWYGLGRTIITAAIVTVAGAALIPLAHGALAFVLLITGQSVIVFASMFYEINTVSLQQALAPESLQGRVAATVRTAGFGTAPAGALLGGMLGQILGIRPTLWIVVAGVAVAVPWLVFSPLWTMREAPATTRPTA